MSDLNGREKTILGLIVVAVFALGLFPDEPMRKTELAAKAYKQLVSTSAPAREGTMIGRDVLMAMLPEHLLLLGIVLLIVLEIAGLAQRASLTVALAAVARRGVGGSPAVLRRLCRGALCRALLGRCGHADGQGAWCWRWRCRCC